MKAPAKRVIARYGLQVLGKYVVVGGEGGVVGGDDGLREVGRRRQSVDFPERDALLEVESARMTAAGRIRLDLTALGSNADLSGSINKVVVLVEDGVRENRTINEAFEFRARSTTE